MTTIVAIAEQRDGELRKIAGEVASETVRQAAAAGCEAVALTVGPGAATAAAGLGEFGIARAIAVEGDSLAQYSGEVYAAAIASGLEGLDTRLVLFGATSYARDLMPRVGVHLDVSPASDIVELKLDGDATHATRPVYAGKAILSLSLTKTPGIASLRPNVFAAEGGKGADCAVETKAPPAATDQCGHLTDRTASAGGKVELSEATVIVAGGRGLETPENFAKLLEPMAETLGAAVGASRAVVDAGWRPHSEQVGQTGKTVAPKLYFAVGISGAIQHLAGMRTSQTIVAINKDAEAPIFKLADFGIVGDANEIIPALTEQITAMK